MTMQPGAEVATSQPLWAKDRWRWTLLAAAAVVLAMFPLVATHPKSLSDLTEAVASGSVSHVWVADALQPGASGYATAEVRWKQGGITHAADVMQASDSSAFAPGTAADMDRMVGDVRQYLRGMAAAEGRPLVIEDASRSGGAELLGWQTPEWVAAAALVLWLLTLGLVVSGPTPWRATRWAWFWIVFSPLGLVGAPAFLALGGRLPWGVRTAPERPVTGGWAFIAMCVLSGALAPLP